MCGVVPGLSAQQLLVASLACCAADSWQHRGRLPPALPQPCQRGAERWLLAAGSLVLPGAGLREAA